MKFTKSLFTALCLYIMYICTSYADLPTYNPSTLPAITECRPGTYLKVQTDPFTVDGDPKLRPRSRTAGYGEFDPIKQEPSHLHIFAGPCDFSMYSTRATLLPSLSNSTDGGPGVDNTLVWQPALIDTRNGNVLKATVFLTYYSRGLNAERAHLVQKTPKGLVFIEGNHLATDYTQNDALGFQKGIFQCSAVTSGPGSAKDKFPLCATNAFLNIKLLAPQCIQDDGTGVVVTNNTANMLVAEDGVISYNTSTNPGLPADGKNYIVGGKPLTDSLNHKSHMAYARTGSWQANANECPTTHPHRVVQNAIIVTYRIPEAAMVPFLKFSSDNGAQGASAHWDYMEAWHRMFYDTFYRECLQKDRDCGNAKLGNGWVLVNPTNAPDLLLNE